MATKNRRVEVRMAFSGNEGGFVAGLPPSFRIVYTTECIRSTEPED
jgi:hypothetical protein